MPLFTSAPRGKIAAWFVTHESSIHPASNLRPRAPFRFQTKTLFSHPVGDRSRAHLVQPRFLHTLAASGFVAFPKTCTTSCWMHEPRELCSGVAHSRSSSTQRWLYQTQMFGIWQKCTVKHCSKQPRRGRKYDSTDRFAFILPFPN